MKSVHPVPSLVQATKISYSLNKPLSVFFSNYTRVCKEPPTPVPEAAQCPCNRYRTAAALSLGGHVISTDPAAFSDLSLRQLWQCGRKYRLPAHPALVLPDLHRGIEEYVHRLCKSEKMDPVAFNEWRARLLAHVEKMTAAIPDTHWVTQGGLSSEGLRELNMLHEHMVVAPTDKSSHDFMFACKKAYLAALHTELSSPAYAVSTTPDEAILHAHGELSKALGRDPINALPYLYGAGKLHKETAGMRWIAGCALQKTGHNAFREFQAPATSISALSAALGAVLCFCMHQLEQKDINVYRPRGIRRYWVVTDVDTVAKHIKAHQKTLAQEEVWTRDFTTMYTKLPLQRIYAGVCKAVEEAFNYYASTFDSKGQKQDPADAKFTFKWSNYGAAELKFVNDGDFQMADIPKWLEAVLHGTFVKQGPASPTRQQVVGVPMGGKSSAELANLYCYSVESATIDTLLQNGQDDVARAMYHTFRYIDDILGFGRSMIHLFDYQMEHKQTNERVDTAVFLGMRIMTSGDFVQLSHEPKGAGWKWKPQRYVEWSSIHTKDTKRMLLKGLLVRSGAITNTMAAFKDSVRYTVEGLHSRGFTRRSLMDSFESYMKDYWSPFPYAAQDVRNWFRSELERLFQQKIQPFGSTSVRAPAKPAAPKAPAPAFTPREVAQGTLLCGLDAINHIMASRGRMPLGRDVLDDVALHVANLEAAIRAEGTAVDTTPHAEGNYHVTVMSLALTHLVDLHVSVWKPGTSTPAFAFIAGDGKHWQAIVQDSGTWMVRDRRSFKVQDLQNYLACRSRKGIVLLCSEDPVDNPMDADCSTAPISKKRPIEEAVNAEQPLLAAAASPEPPSQDEEPEGKKARSTQDSLQSTPALLAHLEGAFQPLPDDVPAPVVMTRAADAPPAETEWAVRQVGVTAVLFNARTNMFRCPSPDCPYIGASPIGVTSHFGKYCKLNPNSSKSRSAAAVDVDNDGAGDSAEDDEDAEQ